MSRRNSSPAYVAALMAAGLFAPVKANAQSKVEPSLTVAANGGYSSNPFLVAGNDVDSAVTQIDARPALDITTEEDQLHLEAYYTRTDYPGKFKSTDSFGGVLRGVSRVDERSTMRANITFDSSVLGATETIGAVIPQPATPGAPQGAIDGSASPTLPVDSLTNADLSLIGLRQRRNLLSLDVGLDTQTGPHSFWTFGINESQADYPHASGLVSSYRTIGLDVTHKRVISPTTTLGGRIDAYAVDYRNAPTSKVYTPQIFLSQRLPMRWTIEASAGASVRDNGTMRAIFSGQLTICRTGEQDRLCFAASRAPAVTGFSGVRTQSALSALYDYRLDLRSTVSASASYSWIASDASNIIGSRRFFSANATYRRDMGHNFSLFAALDYRHIQSKGVTVKADRSGRVGASVRFGGVQ